MVDLTHYGTAPGMEGWNPPDHCGRLAGRMKDFAVARRRMVREQIGDAGITDPRVLRAMRSRCPATCFVPRLLHHRAHQPCALPIGFGQTISKPFTVGLMTALLELKGDERVLEVGTGSGYQARDPGPAGPRGGHRRAHRAAGRPRPRHAGASSATATSRSGPHDGICGVADQRPSTRSW